MDTVGVVIIALAVLAVIVLGSAVRILREYERGVIFRLGRLIALKGPGLILLIPIIDRMVRVDLRTVTLNIPPQEVITRDNVPTSVNAVCYFRVIDANRAIVEVENYLHATSQIAQTALRSILGKAELDQLLAEREKLNEDLQKIIDESTEPWGVKVSLVEIKDVEIPGQMHRALARQAEAERERRAKIINSEGEYQAAQKLADAADIIGENPASIQLRYLQTLLEIGSHQNTTVVFPLPIDLLRSMQESLGGDSGGGGGGGSDRPRGGRPKPPPPEEPEVPPVPSELAGASRGGEGEGSGEETATEAQRRRQEALDKLTGDVSPSGAGGGSSEGSGGEGAESSGEGSRSSEEPSDVADEISKLVNKPKREE